jgi:alpha-L-fucosidase
MMNKPSNGQYEANWDSLRTYKVPDWFKDAKLGIFIHWGVYAVPAFGNEWYPRKMYLEGTEEYEHHQETWGSQSEFGYKDFIPMFKAENWEPRAWVDLFTRAGAKYIVPVAEHHDGFPMYDCPFTNYNAAKMGPRLDTVAELAKLTRQAGLKFGVSTHRAFNWRYYTFAESFDTHDPDYHKLYGIPHPSEVPVSYPFILDWYARTRDLIERFSPDVLWFDFGWHREEFSPWWPKVTAYYYNHGLTHGYEPVLQFKDRIPDDVAVLDIERGKLDTIRPYYWQTDTSISYRSWGFIENDDFKTVTSLVHDLADIVSKNGNLLLNVGPKPDGTLPQPAVDTLEGLGRWMDINGEAIYETRPWTVYGEGPTEVITERFKEKDYQPFTADDIRFTQKGEDLYAICLGWPEDTFTVHALGAEADVAPGRITQVTLLGSDESLEWTQERDALRVSRPSTKPCAHAYTLKITRER